MGLVKVEQWTNRIPINSFLVNQDPHELRNGQGWMSVVQLDGHLVGHVGEVISGLLKHTELWVLVPEV